jgi:uncharacterized protein (TIGR04255 family)
MTDDHEIYPNAPLALVVVEIRFASSSGDRALSMSLQRSIRDALGEDWVIETAKIQQLNVSLGPIGPASQFTPPTTMNRFTVRDRTMAIAITDGTLTIETTNYTHYPEFRETLEKAITTVSDSLQPDGITRIGMRYIDEIRIPDVTEANLGDWSRWLHPSLDAPCTKEMAAAGLMPLGWEGAAQYDTGVNQRLVIRYGSRSGFVVNPIGPLKRPHPPLPGPLFFFDFDSYWEPEGIPEFDSPEVLERCDLLRQPIRVLFDLLTTDELLKEFRKVDTHE